MIKIGFRPTQFAIGSFERVLAEPIKHFRLFAGIAPTKVYWQFHIYMDDVFAAEGIPEWPALAVSTIIQRLHLGFPPEHPILERTGGFRAAVSEMGAPGFVFQTVPLGGESFTLQIGTTDPRFEWFQEGTPDMPARPVMPSDEYSRRELCLMMENVLVPTLEDVIDA